MKKILILTLMLLLFLLPCAPPTSASAIREADNTEASAEFTSLTNSFQRLNHQF